MPVADDYLFLSHLAFESPLDFFSPMGAAYYWRPVSRQLYFMLVGPWLLRAPWLASLLAALLLLALYAVLYRLARRRFDAPVAAALACFPLLAEPARIFLVWPSAAQHLLGALFAALAIERAAAGSLFTSSAAALLALLSNEAAFVVLPALPFVTWFRTRSGGKLARWSAGTLAVAALWGAGYAVARTHGAGLPPGAGAGLHAGPLWAVLVQAFVSQLGYEGLAPALRSPLLALCGLLAVAALALSLRVEARRRIVRTAPALLGGLVWFAAGVTPLALLLPDWNAWRTTVASLGLGFSLTGWLALVSPPLAGTLVALRLAALLFAHPAPAVVTGEPVPTVSGLSLAQITRLQRVVESTRRELIPVIATLPPGGVVRYWQMPFLAEVGFSGDDALHVWARDTTLAWRRFGGAGGRYGRTDALVEYELTRAWPAVRITPEARRLYFAAYDATLSQQSAVADSCLEAARRAQHQDAPAFFGILAQNQAQIAIARHQYARCESLNQVALQFGGETSTYWSVAALLAVLHGDLPSARKDIRRCLALDPRDPDGLRLARDLGIAPQDP